MTRRHVDFTRLIGEMRSTGLQLTEIARRCHCSLSTISIISRDPRRVPSYPVGAALVALHAEVVQPKPRSLWGS